MKYWSSSETARELGLTPQRVRALARAGRLNAQKIGGRWLVVPVSPGARAPAGRPLSAAAAWAVLALMSGQRPDWIHTSAVSRLKRRILSPQWVIESLRQSEPRAQVVRWRALPTDIPKIMELSGIVPTGSSAVAGDVDLVSPGDEIDAYVSREVLRTIDRRFRPAKESDQPNLTLRVPNHPWTLGFERAPLPVVAADLLQSREPRAARAGEDALRRLVND